MEKIILIDNQEINFKATAATPMFYRNVYGRDLLVDIQRLSESLDAGSFDIASLEVFEKVAYIMARSGSSDKENFPKTAEEWLDGFTMMSIYDVLPQLIDLWGINTKTLVKGKKK